MDWKKQFEEGLLSKNPVFVQLLGMCSTLAITTSMFNGLGMGISLPASSFSMDSGYLPTNKLATARAIIKIAPAAQ